MNLTERLEKQLENQTEDKYHQTIVEKRTGNIELKFVRELVFGSNQFSKKIQEIEDELMKQQGYTHSSIHKCGIIHYHKNEITDETVNRINKDCPCAKKSGMNKKGLFLSVCPSGHAFYDYYSLSVMKNCKYCSELLNKEFQKDTPEKIKEMKKLALKNQKEEEGRKAYEKSLEDKEILKQAKILARAEILKEEMKKK
jgi:hypothetical protein